MAFSSTGALCRHQTARKDVQRQNPGLTTDPARPDADVSQHASVTSRPRTGSTVQTQTAIRLADDRVASAAMVAPLVATENVSGLLIALRVGRSFAATDALTASRISELLALEVAREGFADRDQKHRRQAFA